MAGLRSFVHPLHFVMQRALLVLLASSLAAAGAAPSARAQSTDAVTIEATAAPSPVGVRETVTLTIRLEGAALSDLVPPEPPSTKGLVLQRPTPATQRNISFSDGRLTRSVTFRWSYHPVRPGTAQIYPVEVTVHGTTYATDTIDIQVVSQAQRAQQAPPPSGRTPQRPVPSRPSLITEQELFIRAEPEARRAHQNEQVTVAYHLYFREGIQLRHSRLANAWDATGFWREELEVESRPIPRSVTVDGRSYQTIVLKRVALFPTRSGSLWIDPLEIETEARVTSRLRGRIDPFYSPPHAYESVLVSSDSLMIQSEPLPAGAPDVFNGAVGTFRLRASVHPTEVHVGRPVRLRVRIEGAGNIATLQPPAVEPPDDFEMYDPEEQTSIDRSGAHVRGTKTFTYVLVPRSIGTYTLPPAAFAYFDPEADRYRTQRAMPTEVRVIGDDAATTAVSTTGSGLPLDDVAGIMTEPQSWIRTEKRPLYLSPWPYAAVLAPLLAVSGFVAARRRTTVSRSDPAPARDAVYLKQARRCMEHRKPEACYDAIERAVLDLIGKRLNVGVAGLPRAQLDAQLARRDVPGRAREALFELLDVCDQARYSPAESSEQAMQSAIRRAEQLIDFLGAKLA